MPPDTSGTVAGPPDASGKVILRAVPGVGATDGVPEPLDSIRVGSDGPIEQLSPALEHMFALVGGE